MYSQTQDNGSSYLPYDHLSQFTELEIETSNLVGCGNYYSSGSGCSSSYAGSPSSNSMGAVGNNPPTTACGAVDSRLFQRSISSLSLHKGGSSSLLGLAEDSHDDGPVRRVYSAGDLESVRSYMARRSRQRAESPLSVSNENTLIIEGIMKATKYNPEEKRERIERYRNKRNQRNFHKKIQYASRKSLADSRPRIKGRFVRNDEISTIATNMSTTVDGNSSGYYLANDQYSNSHHRQHMMAMMNEGDEEDGYEENSWINLLNYTFASQYEH